MTSDTPETEKLREMIAANYNFKDDVQAQVQEVINHLIRHSDSLELQRDTALATIAAKDEELAQVTKERNEAKFALAAANGVFDQITQNLKSDLARVTKELKDAREEVECPKELSLKDHLVLMDEKSADEYNALLLKHDASRQSEARLSEALEEQLSAQTDYNNAEAEREGISGDRLSSERVNHERKNAVLGRFREACERLDLATNTSLAILTPTNTDAKGVADKKTA